jgi:hypothetical protein
MESARIEHDARPEKGVGQTRRLTPRSQVLEGNSVAAGEDGGGPDSNHAGSNKEKEEHKMKKQALAVAVALVVSITAAGVCFAHRRVVLANIPFAFEAGNKTLPAGRYEIETVPTGAGTLQRIRLVDGDAQVTVHTIAVASAGRKSEPQLIFHRYGRGYFLAQIWNGEGKGQQLYKSAREKEMASTGARLEVAVLVKPLSTEP